MFAKKTVRLFANAKQRQLLVSSSSQLASKQQLFVQKRLFRGIQDAERTQNVLDCAVDTSSEEFKANEAYNKGIANELKTLISEINLGK